MRMIKDKESSRFNAKSPTPQTLYTGDDFEEFDEIPVTDRETITRFTDDDNSHSLDLNFTDTDMIQDGKGGVDLSGAGILNSSVEEVRKDGFKDVTMNINLFKNGHPLNLPSARLNFRLSENSCGSFSRRDLAGVALGVWSSCLLIESTRNDCNPEDLMND